MKTPENHILVIFGASGDLTWRKLIPAIFEMQAQKMLPEGFAVLGLGRSNMNDDAFRAKMKEGLLQFARKELLNQPNIDAFLSRLYFLSADTQIAESYFAINKRLKELDEKYNTLGNNIFYLSVTPALYGHISDNLGKMGMCGRCDSEGWKRLVVEKPFGYNLQTAKELNKKL